MKKVLIVGAALATMLIPFATFAAWAPGQPIVPACETTSNGAGAPYCQLHDLLNLANNIITFAVYLAVLIATIMFVYAGVLYVTAAAQEANLDKAKKIFWTVFLGLVIVLAAWLIINVILSTLTGKGLDSWSSVNKVDIRSVPVGQQPGITIGDQGSTVVTCTNCAPITDIECKPGVSCNADQTLIDGIKKSCAQPGAGCDKLQVTEGFPPHATHTDPQHADGTAADIACIGGCTPAQVKNGLQAFKSGGLDGWYEVPSGPNAAARQQELIDAGVPASQVIISSSATGEHFHERTNDGG